MFFVHLKWRNSFRLDSGNALIYDLPSTQIIQNSATRLVTGTKKFDHISPVLQGLHWLTVKNIIIFKKLLMTFKALRGLASGYLSEFLTPYRSCYNLRLCSANFLAVPRYRTKTYGERALRSQHPVYGTVCLP